MNTTTEIGLSEAVCTTGLSLLCKPGANTSALAKLPKMVLKRAAVTIAINECLMFILSP